MTDLHDSPQYPPIADWTISNSSRQPIQAGWHDPRLPIGTSAGPLRREYPVVRPPATGRYWLYIPSHAPPSHPSLMRGNHTWYIVRLTDGTDQHAHASHIGFEPDGPACGEVIFYGDAAGSRVNMRLPVKAIDQIQAVSRSDWQTENE